MSQILLDLGRTQNQINLTQAKYRAAIEENRTARTARQVAQGMKDGFDLAKVEGIAMNELLEKRAKSQAEEAAEEAAKAAETPKA
jgi:flagellar biosynthesis/type III secretory pathway protein FliH